MWKDGAIHSVGFSGSSTGCGGGDDGGGGEGGGEGSSDGCIVGCGSCCGNGSSCGDNGGDGNGVRVDEDSLILQYKMDEAVCEATKKETFCNIILYTHKIHHHCWCAV